MKNSAKAYLCYRIYRHAMTLKPKVLSAADAKKYLIDALREYFYSHGRILSLQDEIKIIKWINSVTQGATEFAIE